MRWILVLQAIEEAVDGAKGRRLLFIDTCHSAGAYNERLGNATYYANISAYSSARWDQEALESDVFKHGLFTEALVQGLAGAADASKAGQCGHRPVERVFAQARAGTGETFPARSNPQCSKGRDAEVYTYTLAVLH